MAKKTDTEAKNTDTEKAPTTSPATWKNRMTSGLRHLANAEPKLVKECQALLTHLAKLPDDYGAAPRVVSVESGDKVKASSDCPLAATITAVAGAGAVGTVTATQRGTALVRFGKTDLMLRKEHLVIVAKAPAAPASEAK